MGTGFANRGRNVTARGTCQKCKGAIEWVTLASSGKRVPLDTIPDAIEGEVYVIGSGVGWRIGWVIRDQGIRAETLQHGHTLYRFHSDTCPKRPRPKDRYRNDA